MKNDVAVSIKPDRQPDIFLRYASHQYSFLFLNDRYSVHEKCWLQQQTVPFTLAE